MHADGARIRVNKAWAARLTLVVALIVALMDHAAAEQAAPELPTEPILRIETGQHNDAILSIDTDATNQFVVTSSRDKTARVWSLADGRLLRILRLPIGHYGIGQAHSVAISPNGSTIAVGGWGSHRVIDGSHNIYLFDRMSGALERRLSDLPNGVAHLAYSPDGRLLVASFGGGDGILIFDTYNDYRSLPSDTQYGGDSYWAEFDQRGRLVTASFDGFVRLYAAGQYFTPIARFLWEGHHPYRAVFSPDGTRIAVGDHNNPDVVVLSGTNLTQLFRANAEGIPYDTNVGTVAWSPDGYFLYAGGDWAKSAIWQVRRWSDGGRGPFVDIAVGLQVSSLRTLRSGSILYGAFEGFGLIAPDVKVTQLQSYGALSVAACASGLRVSADGDIVHVEPCRPRRHSYRFSVVDRLLRIDVPADIALEPAITRAPGIDITEVGSGKPRVNGKPISLAQNERALSVAIVPGEKRFVLGADFSLRLLEGSGRNVWPQPVMENLDAFQVNVTRDKRLVVVVGGGGTIRWHRLSDGKEVLALFIHPDGQRWILWTPEGYYDAAAGADELIGWHVNHGYDQAPDFYPVSQFRSRFYRPDIIQRVLQTPDLDVNQAARDADKEAGRRPTTPALIKSLLTFIKAALLNLKWVKRYGD